MHAIICSGIQQIMIEEPSKLLSIQQAAKVAPIRVHYCFIVKVF